MTEELGTTYTNQDFRNDLAKMRSKTIEVHLSVREWEELVAFVAQQEIEHSLLTGTTKESRGIYGQYVRLYITDAMIGDVTEVEYVLSGATKNVTDYDVW